MYRIALLTLGALLLFAILSIGTGPAPASPRFYKVCTKTQTQPCAMPPRVINHPAAEYSEDARRSKVEGAVLLGLIVGIDGRPHDIHVVHSLGHGLDEKAIEALRTWTFGPGTKEGTAVPTLVNVEIQFHLYH
jgi:TonB family protein